MEEDNEPKKKRSLFARGPLGLGDPDDKRLRKAEKDIIIPKRLREEATQKCGKSIRRFLECAKNAGLLVTVRCKEENESQLKCLAKWVKNEKFINEITQKYLEERTYYRRHGVPLNRQLETKAELPYVDEEYIE